MSLNEDYYERRVPSFDPGDPPEVEYWDESEPEEEEEEQPAVELPPVSEGEEECPF